MIPWLLQFYLTGKSPASVEAVVTCEPCVVEASMVEISPMVSFKERTVVFEVETIPKVTVPGRVVVVRISGEFIVVDDCRCWCIDRSVDRRGGNISAAVDDRAVEIRPVIDRESDSYVANSCVTKTGADIYLGIAFGSDQAAGYDGGEEK